MRAARVFAICTLVAVGCLAFAFLERHGGAAERSGGERRLTIFYSGEVHGTLEPCGCTSDPLGDVARYAAEVRATARSTPTLMVDGGGLSYPETSNPKERGADELRARFLARTLPSFVPFAAGLSDLDLRRGTDVTPRRLAVNVGDSPALAPSVLKTVGGIRVGVFGVADPALAEKLGVRVDDPISAARREVDRLRRSGAEVVIALAPLDRALARRMARAASPDIVVLGRQLGKGQARAEQVGSSFLVAAAEELERVGRLDLVLRGAGPLSDSGGPAAAALRRQEIDEATARLDDQLKSWAKTAGGDPSFVATKRREREALAAERRQLDAPWAPPANGNYFTNELIPLRRTLPRDPGVAAAMRRLDREVAAINLRHAAPPPPAEPGRPYYVGDAKCGACHKEALAFWTSTVHATAWRTLVAVGKQNDYRCAGCHVTGYGQVGGSSLGHTDKLRDVQCEVCHGPGSIHVAEKGLEEPSSVRRDVPASTCTACHTEQHSDTFQYEAYLRDILGPGHAAAARQKLGDGPTGHELRSAALSRAKSAGTAEAKSL
jgi:cytochrome c554/c'-like protein